MVRDIDMNQVDLPGISRRFEAQNKRRVRIGRLEFRRSPGLNYQDGRDDCQYRATQRTFKRTVFSSRRFPYRYRRSGNCPVFGWIQIHFVQYFCRGRQYDSLRYHATHYSHLRGCLLSKQTCEWRPAPSVRLSKFYAAWRFRLHESMIRACIWNESPKVLAAPERM